MQIKASDEWSRKLVVTDIPVKDSLGIIRQQELSIIVNYDNDNKMNPCGNGAKAIVLDGQVIPQITKAVNCHEALVESLAEMVELFERHISGKEGPDDAAARWDRARDIVAKATEPS
jgi:hypothetical protein